VGPDAGIAVTELLLVELFRAVVLSWRLSWHSTARAGVGPPAATGSPAVPKVSPEALSPVGPGGAKRLIGRRPEGVSGLGAGRVVRPEGACGRPSPCPGAGRD
jgi:hypothetical protein